MKVWLNLDNVHQRPKFCPRSLNIIEWYLIVMTKSINLVKMKLTFWAVFSLLADKEIVSLGFIQTVGTQLLT